MPRDILAPIVEVRIGLNRFRANDATPTENLTSEEAYNVFDQLKKIATDYEVTPEDGVYSVSYREDGQTYTCTPVKDPRPPVVEKPVPSSVPTPNPVNPPASNPVPTK